jgi:hypothetical protein
MLLSFGEKRAKKLIAGKLRARRAVNASTLVLRIKNKCHRLSLTPGCQSVRDILQSGDSQTKRGPASSANS